MSKPITISSAPPARVSMNYAALREGGMESIRQWASDSWTDHNLHDPGITILEASSYAMTELGLRLQLDVGDLLRSGESVRAPDLPPADRVLPVGPITPQDLRRVLLDHPLVSDAQLFLPADGEVLLYGPPLAYTPGPSRIRPGGLYEVLVELSTRELNGNTYSFQVTSGGQSYSAGQAWRALPEAQSYFGKIDISYTTPAGPDHVVTWAVLQITTVLPQPGLVLPGLLADARTAVESLAPGLPVPPVLQFADRVRRAAAAVTQQQTYLAGWRNLGEQAVRNARIEVTGGIDVEQLLAEIFSDVDEMLSPRVRFVSLSARRNAKQDPDAIYDGPLLRNGFLAADAVATERPSVLFLSDVLRLIMRRRNAAGSDVVAQENPVGRDKVAGTHHTQKKKIKNKKTKKKIINRN